MKEIDDILEQMAAEDLSNKGKKLSPLHMFKQHYISRTLILILGWTCTCVGYYRLIDHKLFSHLYKAWRYLVNTVRLECLCELQL